MTEQLPLFEAEVLRATLSDATTPGFIAELGSAGPVAAGAFEKHALTGSAAPERSRDELSLELFP